MYTRAACRALYAVGRQFEACHSIQHSIKHEDIFFKNDRRDTVISAMQK